MARSDSQTEPKSAPYRERLGLDLSPSRMCGQPPDLSQHLWVQGSSPAAGAGRAAPHFNHVRLLTDPAHLHLYHPMLRVAAGDFEHAVRGPLRRRRAVVIVVGLSHHGIIRVFPSFHFLKSDCHAAAPAFRLAKLCSKIASTSRRSLTSASKAAMFAFLLFKMRWKLRLLSRSIAMLIRASPKGPRCVGTYLGIPEPALSGSYSSHENLLPVLSRVTRAPSTAMSNA